MSRMQCCGGSVGNSIYGVQLSNGERFAYRHALITEEVFRKMISSRVMISIAPNLINRSLTLACIYFDKYISTSIEAVQTINDIITPPAVGEAES